MSNKLEVLVPPLELCKKIPAGEFEDSALVWMGNPPFENIIVRDVAFSVTFTPPILKTIVPAPTLQEIMAELTEAQDAFRIEFEDGKTMWMVADSGYEDNAATAALKAYFQEKGIKA